LHPETMELVLDIETETKQIDGKYESCIES
jgi:hypothetical protein